MAERRLKKSVVYFLYATGFVIAVTTLYLIEMAIYNANFHGEEDLNYVDKIILDDQNIPVVSVSSTFTRPYTAEGVTILKGFYDMKSDEKTQQDSLIYHEGTYLQSSGVAYGSKEVFDVLSIYDGIVISVKQDTLLGGIVQVRHNNGIVSIYQSLSEIQVKENDSITKGSVIGKSGTSNLSKELGNHLHFELIYNGQTVNPEEYFDKTIDDL